MATEDAIRWNQRYRDAPADWWQQPRSFLINHLDLLPKKGLALDLATGMGQNAGLLLAHGLDVIGVDISSAGVFHARSTNPRLMGLIADLDEYVFPADSFDLILNFYFLSRRLCAEFSRMLKPGGLLVFETLTEDLQTLRPNIPSDYLLTPGEARQMFNDWEIMVYKEGWTRSDHGKTKPVASLIARLPEN